MFCSRWPGQMNPFALVGYIDGKATFKLRARTGNSKYPASPRPEQSLETRYGGQGIFGIAQGALNEERPQSS
jgi:hypothetical protein